MKSEVTVYSINIVLDTLINDKRFQGIKVEDMIESAKKYYTSWGFSPLPEDFWVNSIFKKKNDNMDCSAAVFYFLTGQDMHYR